MPGLIVLSYSGGLDTSAIVPWLREVYAADVLCYTADVGQGVGELAGLEEGPEPLLALHPMATDQPEDGGMPLRLHRD